VVISSDILELESIELELEDSELIEDSELEDSELELRESMELELLESMEEDDDSELVELLANNVTGSSDWNTVKFFPPTE
jgi:hypothetical protein